MRKWFWALALAALLPVVAHAVGPQPAPLSSPVEVTFGDLSRFSDLRFVTVAMKISQNLERIGDEAAKIAKRARDLSKEAPLKVNVGVWFS